MATSKTDWKRRAITFTTFSLLNFLVIGDDITVRAEYVGVFVFEKSLLPQIQVNSTMLP